jgi:hypothetical protein
VEVIGEEGIAPHALAAEVGEVMFLGNPPGLTTTMRSVSSD